MEETLVRVVEAGTAPALPVGRVLLHSQVAPRTPRHTTLVDSPDYLEVCAPMVRVDHGWDRAVSRGLIQRGQGVTTQAASISL